jgi:hypothetical protein
MKRLAAILLAAYVGWHVVLPLLLGFAVILAAAFAWWASHR